MALIECLECEKMISDSATSCPSCGCPMVSNKINNDNDGESTHLKQAMKYSVAVPQIPTGLYVAMAILGFPIGTGAAIGFNYRQKSLLNRGEYEKLAKEITIGKITSWIIIIPCALCVLFLMFLLTL